eukprot:CAMPEP_0172670324 /NCGR_PEP_ID=MMETSP1074-20121228/10232_1 /TAXON_ID=2916 /ORGANISM="Ceratium fusus, Strain PA161109" /LENGTH=88 /DNA_ID=CAMNT_0013487223 /DNA_START=452 /DNA_END=719 /DNA_ORIENTATION=-
MQRLSSGVVWRQRLTATLTASANAQSSSRASTSSADVSEALQGSGGKKLNSCRAKLCEGPTCKGASTPVAALLLAPAFAARSPVLADD